MLYGETTNLQKRELIGQGIEALRVGTYDKIIADACRFQEVKFLKTQDPDLLWDGKCKAVFKELGAANDGLKQVQARAGKKGPVDNALLLDKATYNARVKLVHGSSTLPYSDNKSPWKKMGKFLFDVTSGNAAASEAYLPVRLSLLLNDTHGTHCLQVGPETPMIVLSSPPWGVLSSILLSRFNVDETDAECRKDVALTEDEIAELGNNAILAAAGRPLMLILHLTVALAAQYNNVLQGTYEMKEVPMVFVREGGYIKQKFFDKKRGLQPAYKELTSSTDLFFIWVPKDEDEIEHPRRSIPWQFPIARALIGTYYATYV